VLTVFLLLVPLQKLNLDGGVRARVAVITGLAVLGYVMTVYLIFFLTYTPLNIDHVRGVASIGDVRSSGPPVACRAATHFAQAVR
jgi:hypothetical protein